MKKSANKILIDRGPFISKLKREKPVSHVSGVASAFVSDNKKKGLRVFVAGGSRPGKDAVYQKEAFLLGKKIGEMGYHLDFGLSSTGVMGAVARGVLAVWVKEGRLTERPIKGVTTKEYLSLYRNDKVIDEISEIIVAKTLEERKRQLLKAEFVIFAPGGVGTLDELVYDCVAMQDGFLSFKPFILFNVEGFFHHLLEYLKEINLKGFSDPMPFIVVDNSFEAGIAFELLFQYYVGGLRGAALEQVKRIIYELPYFIEVCSKNKKLSVADVIAQNQKVVESGTLAAKKTLKKEIEKAYFKKEMKRLKSRFEKTKSETSILTGKMSDLNHRKIAKR